MRFEGKKVVVTGGGGGMGQAISLEFAREGADVAVLDMVADNAEKVAKEVRALGRKAIPMMVDVASYRAVQDCIGKVLKEFKDVDVLVNGAGYAQYAPFTELTEEMWDRSVNIHLKGTFNATHAIVPGMIARRSGRIISISSVAGVTGTAKGCHYSAAKAGVIGLTKALSKELAPLGITVNAIAPGATDTHFLDAVAHDLLQMYIKSTPVGRLCTPAEIGALCAYLASPEAGFITGQVINISGGFYV